MQPRTQIQKEVATLSRQLSSPTEAQRKYAFDNCIKHYAYVSKSNASCMECGRQWQGVYEDDEECICPHCGQRLVALKTRARVYKQTDYFCVLTTKDKYQVIRYYQIQVNCKIGQQAKYSFDEVVQRWIDPHGRNAIVARLRGMCFYYQDTWCLSSSMEIRRENQYDVYNIYPYKVYPRMRLIPELKRNGFSGEFHEMKPFSLFDAILRSSKSETLLKTGQINLLKFSTHRSNDIEKYWPSIKICIRTGYNVEDASMWIDYLDMLSYFGKDIHSAKYVCPNDLRLEHDLLVSKKRKSIERERLINAREEAVKNEKAYSEAKGMFFGVAFTDGEIKVRVLESVNEFVEEGTAMHHCVFTNKYFKKEDSLILSATIDGERVETIEVSLKKLEVVQSRGKCNQNTEYHDRIINLVNKNMNQISSRIAE